MEYIFKTNRTFPFKNNDHKQTTNTTIMTSQFVFSNSYWFRVWAPSASMYDQDPLNPPHTPGPQFAKQTDVVSQDIWRLQTVRFGFRLKSIWNFTGLSNFTTIRSSWHPISRLRDLMRYGVKTVVRSLKRERASYNRTILYEFLLFWNNPQCPFPMLITMEQILGY